LSSWQSRTTIVLQQDDYYDRLPALAERYEDFMFLDSHQHSDPYGRWDWFCAFGQQEGRPRITNVADLEVYPSDWYCGHLNYNLKNTMELLHTAALDSFAWAELSFFCPHTILYRQGRSLYLHSSRWHSEEAFRQMLPHEPRALAHFTGLLKARLSREQYLQKLEQLMAHLHYGNIYEVNFCLELAGEGRLDPVAAFTALNPQHQAPFTALYRQMDQHLLCFSPERYLQKRGARLISQPIKGTARRHVDPQRDEAARQHLLKSEKERAENVMIVDLVRNDLSRVASRASVQVDELFGLYRFNAVHQLISTISALVKEQCGPADILRATFPMGSMTGAPKVSAMKIIEETEELNRSLYSGSVGYFTPEGDFDFNVVIRSLLYDSRRERLSLRVGSAITAYCKPEEEYEECLLKAAKIIDALHGSSSGK